MSKTGMYMDGRGIIKRTEKLCDELWDAVPLAWLGLSAMFIGPLLSWAFFVHKMPWDEPATTFDIKLALAFSFLFVVFGVLASYPWFNAYAESRRHRKAIEKETEKHGEGWADS
jgi:hypothetical protein